MNSTDSIGLRLRAARERLGLSIEQAAARMHVMPEALSLMEKDDDEIGSNCTLADVGRFAVVLQTTARELFGIPVALPSLKLAALEQLIREYCQAHGISRPQFEEKIDWPGGTKIEDLPLVLITDICKVVGINWRRVYASCDDATSERR